MKRAINLWMCLLMALALAGCATSTTLLTGQGILAMGGIFVATADTYNQLLDQGVITDEEYGEWAVFAWQFKQAYPSLVNVYRVYATGEARDLATEQQVVALIGTLHQELMTFMLKTRGR